MMRKCLIVAVAIVVLTLAFASIAIAGPPPKGSCPDGLKPLEDYELCGTADLNRDGWICILTFGVPADPVDGVIVCTDNVIPPPFVP